MRQKLHLIILIGLAVFLTTGCKGVGGSSKHVPQATDSLYTEKAALDVYAREPARALGIIDTALMVGNLTDERADLLRATVYSRAYEATRQDTAIVIGERLLKGQTAKKDAAFRKNVLEVLVYSARHLEDYELQFAYTTELADAYRQQGDHVETLRTEAEIGAVLVRLGKTEEGLEKLDSVINILTPVRRFNELDASIIAMKRKMGIVKDYHQIETTAQHIIDRLADFEQHPADFHDGSEREPNDDDRPGYIAFYRSQAWSYLAAACAHLSKKEKVKGADASAHSYLQRAREYVALLEQSDFGKTLPGRKMIAPTLCILGEYGKMEATYQEMESVLKKRGDTLTLDYAQLLLDRATAAEAQGRAAESIALWQKHAEVLQKAEERLLRSKANLYAARYHAQEQQREIERKDGEALRNGIIAWALSIIALLAIAFAVVVMRKNRAISHKNRILAKQVTELFVNPQPTADSQPVHETEKAQQMLDTMSPEQLFLFIRNEVLSKQLYTDPGFGRQAVIDRFHLSKDRASSIFSQGSGHSSISDFINECRLDHARRLLVSRPDMSIADIATASGFGLRTSFTRSFKQKHGLTPSEFREQQDGVE